MLRFGQGIQQNFKAINVEPVPRTRVPLSGEVTPEASVDQGHDEASGDVRYWVVALWSAHDGKIGVVVTAKTPRPEWVTLVFHGGGRQCFKRKNLRQVTGWRSVETTADMSSMADSLTVARLTHARRLIAGSTLAEEEVSTMSSQEVCSHILLDHGNSYVECPPGLRTRRQCKPATDKTEMSVEEIGPPGGWRQEDKGVPLRNLVFDNGT